MISSLLMLETVLFKLFFKKMKLDIVIFVEKKKNLFMIVLVKLFPIVLLIVNMKIFILMDVTVIYIHKVIRIIRYILNNIKIMKNKDMKKWELKILEIHVILILFFKFSNSIFLQISKI